MASANPDVRASMQRVDAPNPLLIMEDVIEKLKIINYEQEFLAKRSDIKPLPRTYFVLSTSPAQQFPVFGALVSYLFQCLQIDFLLWSEFDDPTTVINSIIEVAKGKLRYSGDLSGSKLRLGSGEAVCMLLDFLTDKVLQKRRWQPSDPIHSSISSAQEEALVDESAIVDDEVEEDVAEEEEFATGGGFSDIDPSPLLTSPSEESKRKITSAASSQQQTLDSAPAFDPTVWRLEVERVSHKLKLPNSSSIHKEWRSHLEQSTKHASVLKSEFPTTQQHCQKLMNMAKQAVEKIQMKERHINKEFESLGSEFRIKQKEFETIQEQYNQASTQVSNLQQNLTSTSEQFELIKSQWQDKNTKMTDTTPLKTLVASYNALKDEINGLDLKLGVVSQTLMQAKLKQQASNKE